MPEEVQITLEPLVTKNKYPFISITVNNVIVTMNAAAAAASATVTATAATAATTATATVVLTAINY